MKSQTIPYVVAVLVASRTQSVTYGFLAGFGAQWLLGRMGLPADTQVTQLGDELAYVLSGLSPR